MMRGPRIDDPQLAALDVSVIFAFSCARALGSVLISPDFEGWLAPISVEPIRFSDTLGFASYCSLLWVLGTLSVDGYSGLAIEDTRTAVGVAFRSWLAAGAIYTVATFALAIGFDCCAGWFCADTSMWGRHELLLAPDIPTVLGSIGLGLALISWRVTFAEFRDPWR